MTHPYHHSTKSVKTWGGKEEDYQPIHDWLDATKIAYCDVRHRALRHHSFGIFEAEEKFGKTIVNSDGKHVPVRYIAEQHIKEDCGGMVPSVSDWLSKIKQETWMSRGYNVTQEDIDGFNKHYQEGNPIISDELYDTLVPDADFIPEGEGEKVKHIIRIQNY